MSELKYDNRTPADYQEIAQELFDKLISIDWEYANTGMRSAEVQHCLPGCILYFNFGMNPEKDIVCQVHARYVYLSSNSSFVGSVILKRKGG